MDDLIFYSMSDDSHNNKSMICQLTAKQTAVYLCMFSSRGTYKFLNANANTCQLIIMEHNSVSHNVVMYLNNVYLF